MSFLIILGKKSGGSWIQRILAAGFAFVLAMGVEILLDWGIMKPSIGVPRPEKYSAVLDSPLTGLVHTVLGSGNDFPSGSVARQVVLACLLMWICSHPWLTLGRAVRYLLYIISWWMVVLVAIQRVYVGAHSIESVLVGVSSGIVGFWVVAVLFGALVYEQARKLLPDLMLVWVISMVGWLILATNRMAVTITIIAIVVVLSVWERFARWTLRRINAAIERQQFRQVDISHPLIDVGRIIA